HSSSSARTSSPVPTSWGTHRALAAQSVTVVVQDARSGRTFNARNRAQVFLNRAEIVIRHALERGPRHDLQQIAVEGEGDAAGIHGRTGAAARRMCVVEVDAGSHDLAELVEGVTTLWQSRFIGCEIAGDDFVGAGLKVAKVTAAAQIGCGIHLLRSAEHRLEQKWISSGGELHRRIGGVAAIAVRLSIDDIAAVPHEITILAFEVQLDGPDLKTDLHLLVISCPDHCC